MEHTIYPGIGVGWPKISGIGIGWNFGIGTSLIKTIGKAAQQKYTFIWIFSKTSRPNIVSYSKVLLRPYRTSKIDVVIQDHICELPIVLYVNIYTWISTSRLPLGAQTQSTIV